VTVLVVGTGVIFVSTMANGFIVCDFLPRMKDVASNTIKTRDNVSKCNGFIEKNT